MKGIAPSKSSNLYRLPVSLFTLLQLFIPALAAESLGTIAFPEAEGYGALSQGGRGGKLLFVDRTDDARSIKLVTATK